MQRPRKPTSSKPISPDVFDRLMDAGNKAGNQLQKADEPLLKAVPKNAQGKPRNHR